MKKDLFFYENYSSEYEPKHVKIHFTVKEHFYSKKSFYQQIDFYDSYDHGIIFALDNILMCTERDEFIYHESLACITSFCHPNPKSVLVIGGGDGGLLCQLTKIKNFESIHLCELDPLVIETCKKYLPYLNKALLDPRVQIYIEDGFEFLKTKQNQYDIILVDSTEPIGECAKLFSKNFHELLYKALNETGIFMAQAASPFYSTQFLIDHFKTVKSMFPTAKILITPCHSYPGGNWGFVLGSKLNSLSHFNTTLYEDIKDQFDYYHKGIQKSAFSLPNYLRKELKKLVI